MKEKEWEAIVSCDATYDGQFFYGVRTTKIYCRPSCRSRTPLKANVQVHAARDFFSKLGYRACKRCQPDSELFMAPKQVLIKKASDLIHDKYHENLTLRSLAEMLYISPYYFQKTFKEIEGKSPAQYVMEIRIRAAQNLIKESTYSISEISVKTGFKTPSHFSRVFQRVTGTPPSYFRQKVLT